MNLKCKPMMRKTTYEELASDVNNIKVTMEEPQ